VLEVETPLLARYSVTDPYMDVISTDSPEVGGERFYLQTSPEYAMKRLLVAGSGPVFQISKAFRRGEFSRRHNPEFTMLEWYRPGFDDVELMDEVADLARDILRINSCQKISYRQAFQDCLGIDPHVVSSKELQEIARSNMDVQMHSDNKDDWLNLLMAEVIEPQLPDHSLVFIYDYPESQAALARKAIDSLGVNVAKRFELYANGMELANGYYELTDASEQRKRFEAEKMLARDVGNVPKESDQYLLAAMEQQGLPSCAGVALGLDRLLMLAMGCDDINQVIAFPVERA